MFTESLTSRVSPRHKSLVSEYVSRFPDRWDSESSFVRAALERFVRELRRDGVFLFDESVISGGGC